MKNYDPEKTARVFQRVRGEVPTPPAAPQDVRALPALIAGELSAAAAYRQLALQFTGEDAALLRKMSRQEQSHAACLKGLYTMLTGKHSTFRGDAPDRRNPEAVLRHCYLGELRSVAEYTSRQEDPEYGMVFAQLAQEEREHCRNVLSLLGVQK